MGGVELLDRTTSSNMLAMKITSVGDLEWVQAYDPNLTTLTQKFVSTDASIDQEILFKQESSNHPVPTSPMLIPLLALIITISSGYRRKKSNRR